MPGPTGISSPGQVVRGSFETAPICVLGLAKPVSLELHGKDESLFAVQGINAFECHAQLACDRL